MISRNRLIFIAVLIEADLLIFTMLSFVGEPQSIWRWMLWVFQLVLWILFYASARCPFCHRFGLHFRWSDEAPGYCKYCGQYVEFKEYQDGST